MKKKISDSLVVLSFFRALICSKCKTKYERAAKRIIKEGKLQEKTVRQSKKLFQKITGINADRT